MDKKLLDKKSNSLKEQVKDLSAQIKKKDHIIHKYKKALEESNIRIENISQKLKKTFSLVQQINTNLIPTQLPSIPGFEISYKMIPTQKGVSGDFFDVIKIQDSMKFIIMLSSVSSYSLNSVLLSSFLKSVHNKYADKDFLNLLTKTIKNSFKKESEKIHLFYAVISRQSFEMDYYLVGDIFAGHYQKAQGFKMLAPCAKSLLQTNQKMKYKQSVLKTGDILLLCSPGLKHRENEQGEAFGEKRILSSALGKVNRGVLEIRQKLLFDCNQFGKHSKSLTDCSVLAIQNKNQRLKIQKDPGKA